MHLCPHERKATTMRKQSNTHGHRNTTTLSLEADEPPVHRYPTDDRRVGLDALEAPRIQVLRLLVRIERLAQKIDEAFCGQPFLLNLPPTAPANRRRFNAYFEHHKKVTKLLSWAVELYMITCGMKPEDDWVPLVIEDMRFKAQRREGKPDPDRGRPTGNPPVP